MNGRRIALAVGVVTLAASGTYVFVYLYRWEWNRALTAGLFFLAAEIGLVAAVLAERIRRLEHRLDQPGVTEPAYTQVRSRLAEARPPARDHFAWMRSNMERTNVFIPVLMGAGVILSALAWLVERVARATANPHREAALAKRLLPITLPAEPIVGVDDPTATDAGLALLLRPNGEALR
jgi:hypothetical protein